MAILSLLLVRSLLAARSASAANLEGRLTEIAGNKTLLNQEFFAGWNDQPISRGTSEILWSCLVTLGACIYTAIHLNIPIRHRTKWERLGAKVKWALMALIAPEIVVGTALQQYMEARRVCKTLNDLNEAVTKGDCEANASKSSRPVPESPRYQLAYGFWVVMGGFVADTSGIHDEINRVVLTREGFELLAREGHQLPMPIEQITDRSKANLLAKAIVCAQVIWMLAQCITRKASGYPLTLLEVHTMIHVACALAIYSLWWHKPLDVEEPTMVNCSEFMDLLALMLMVRKIVGSSGEYLSESRRVAFYQRAGDATLNTTLPSSKFLAKLSHSSDEVGSPVIMVVDLDGYFPKVIEDRFQFRRPNAVVTLQTGQVLSCGMGPCFGGVVDGNERDVHFSLELTDLDVHRWVLATKALEKLEKLPRRSNRNNEYQWKGTRYDGCNYGIGTRAKNWGSSEAWGYTNAVDFSILLFSPFLTDTRLLYTAMAVLPFFYGGIHLAAWQFAFASAAEATLWKIACLGIMAGSPVYAVTQDLVFRFFDGNSWILSYIAVAYSAIFLPLFALFRTFIVLEAFLSLRSVPVGVYATVSWVQNLPHL